MSIPERVRTLPSHAPAAVLMCLTGLRIDGGIASVSRCIARALDEEVRAGQVRRVDQVLLYENPADAWPPPAKGDQRFARGSQWRFVWNTWRSYTRHRHDLVFFDLFGLARSVALPLPGFPPARIAIFVHGMELAGTEAHARALGLAELLLANSQHTAGRIRAAFPQLADRIRVVELCIDPERTALWERADRPGADVPRERAALIVGRMWAEERGKGHDALLDAWPSVQSEVPDAELWIVGGGDDAPRLQAKAHELGIAECVRFLGRVSDDDLGKLYRRASVFAMPSRQEGFGLVFAEAMWWGLPCIGSTADAAGQVIADGETGHLVPYGDATSLSRALVRRLTQPAETARMGEACRRRAREHFGYERFRADLLAALSPSS